MPRASRGSRTRVWALGTAFAVAIAVGMVLVPGIWSAASARASWSFETPKMAASCYVGAESGPAYDPVNHELYIAGTYVADIFIIKPPCTVVATICPGGINCDESSPTAAAFDPQNNHMYVTDFYFSQVYVFSGTKIIKTISGHFDGPWGIAYDPANGGMVVTNYHGNDVSYIFNLTWKFNVAVGSNPMAVSYDPHFGYLDVADYGGSNVTILDASNLSHVADVTVGSAPDGVAYDPADLEDYVTNMNSGNVSVLCGTSVCHTISGFNEPAFATWSQAKLAIYVTDSGPAPESGALCAIQGITVVEEVSTVSLWYSTYDDANNNLYVVTAVSGNLLVYPT